MKPSYLPSIPPPLDDSPDLTDVEIEQAVMTTDEPHLTMLLREALSPGQASIGKGDARHALGKQEIRRRKPHLYLRCHLVCPSEPPKILVYQIDWLQQLAQRGLT